MPGKNHLTHDVDAVVIAFATRTAPAKSAMRQSLTPLRWVQGRGAKQFFFKYFSTFDSIPRGNIGPVADGMPERAKGDITIAYPAFPTNGRTVFHGYLFVGDVLLSASGMRNHLLIPMRNANLVEVLAEQTPYGVGLVRWERSPKAPMPFARRWRSCAVKGHCRCAQRPEPD